MTTSCEDFVRFLLEQGSDYSVVNGLVRVAAEHDPKRFMHLVPEELLAELKSVSQFVPASIDGLFYVESSVYRPSAFAGLNPAEIEAKIERARIEGKEQMLRGLTALNKFFGESE
jgi:hypothetical protein